MGTLTTTVETLADKVSSMEEQRKGESKKMEDTLHSAATNLQTTLTGINANMAAFIELFGPGSHVTTTLGAVVDGVEKFEQTTQSLATAVTKITETTQVIHVVVKYVGYIQDLFNAVPETAKESKAIVETLANIKETLNSVVDILGVLPDQPVDAARSSLMARLETLRSSIEGLIASGYPVNAEFQDGDAADDAKLQDGDAADDADLQDGDAADDAELQDDNAVDGTQSVDKVAYQGVVPAVTEESED